MYAPFWRSDSVVSGVLSGCTMNWNMFVTEFRRSSFGQRVGLPSARRFTTTLELFREVTTRLSSLEADLRPKDLLQKVRSIVLSEELVYIGIDSTVDCTTDVQRSMQQVEAIASDLGSAVAADQNAFAALLP